MCTLTMTTPPDIRPVICGETIVGTDCVLAEATTIVQVLPQL